MPRSTLLAALAALALVAWSAPASAQGFRLSAKGRAAEKTGAWLGVNLGQGKYGVKMEAVYRGAPADLAGIEPGDEILSIDGERLRGYRELQQVVGERREVGDEIDIKLLRDGRTVRVTALLGRFPDDEELFRLLMVEKPAESFSLPVMHGEGSGDLATYRGDVVLLAFVSQSCGQCPEVLEALSQQSDRLGEKGLATLAITDRPSAAALRQLRQSAANFQLLYDAGRRVWRVWLGTRPIQPPVLFVIDRDGVVQWAGRDLDDMRSSVEAALRERNGIPIE